MINELNQITNLLKSKNEKIENISYFFNFKIQIVKYNDMLIKLLTKCLII